MDIVMKSQNLSCLASEDSVSLFMEKYGSLGYLAQLSLDATERDLVEKKKNMADGSLFKAFFLQSQSTSQTELAELSSDRHVKIVTGKYA